MPTGERSRTRASRAHGFTYLALLLWLVVGGGMLAALGTQWRAAAERERERELIFRGGQIRAAVARYWDAQSPGELPPSLDALLEDRRTGVPRHHLRRLFADPFAPAGSPGGGWQPIVDPLRGGLAGVASQRTELRYLQPGATRFVFVPPTVADVDPTSAAALRSLASTP